jgi:hypothetical protein
MGDVRAVTFPNADGRLLFGTLHLPAQRRAELPAVVLYSPGAKMRVGPGRLYVPLTEVLTAMGYLVLRFDFYGLGDSEGDLEETVLADVYTNIQVGRYVADGQIALEWLRREYGASRFIVGGLCGGALTGLLVAEREPSIEALLSIGMTVTLDSDGATPSKYLTRFELAHLRQGYLAKLLNPKAWLRLLTFRSDFSVIVRSMLAGLADRVRGVAGGRAASTSTPMTSPADLAAAPHLANVNPLFPTAFFAFLDRGGRALMVFSEKDRMLGDWREKFLDLHPEPMRRFAPQVREHVVAGANHVLSERAWQQEMHDVARQWLAGLSRA